MTFHARFYQLHKDELTAHPNKYQYSFDRVSSEPHNNVKQLLHMALVWWICRTQNNLMTNIWHSIIKKCINTIASHAGEYVAVMGPSLYYAQAS